MNNPLSRLFAFCAFACFLASCDAFIPERSPGRLIIRFSEDVFVSTRAYYEIPDTNDFILTILDSGGKELYNGAHEEKRLSEECLRAAAAAGQRVGGQT